MLNIQPKDSGGGSGETRESVVYRQADEMLEKLPEDYIPFEVSMQHRLNSLSIVRIECDDRRTLKRETLSPPF